jgi:hypothetical protein
MQTALEETGYNNMTLITFTVRYCVSRIKEDEMGVACTTYGRGEEPFS